MPTPLLHCNCSFLGIFSPFYKKSFFLRFRALFMTEIFTDQNSYKERPWKITKPQHFRGQKWINNNGGDNRGKSPHHISRTQWKKALKIWCEKESVHRKIVTEKIRNWKNFLIGAIKLHLLCNSLLHQADLKTFFFKFRKALTSSSDSSSLQAFLLQIPAVEEFAWIPLRSL